MHFPVILLQIKNPKHRYIFCGCIDLPKYFKIGGQLTSHNEKYRECKYKEKNDNSSKKKQMSDISVFVFHVFSACIFPWQANRHLKTQHNRNQYGIPGKLKTHAMIYFFLIQILSWFFLIRWTSQIINIQTFSIMYDLVLLQNFIAMLWEKGTKI